MSILKVNQLQTVAGVNLFTSKAWLNMNGTGTIAIRNSGNVSGITDNGVGDYTVRYSTTMGSASYSFTSGGQIYAPAGTGGQTICIHPTVAPTATAVRIVNRQGNVNTNYDAEYACISIFI